MSEEMFKNGYCLANQIKKNRCEEIDTTCLSCVAKISAVAARRRKMPVAPARRGKLDTALHGRDAVDFSQYQLKNKLLEMAQKCILKNSKNAVLARCCRTTETGSINNKKGDQNANRTSRNERGHCGESYLPTWTTLLWPIVKWLQLLLFWSMDVNKTKKIQNESQVSE